MNLLKRTKHVDQASFNKSHGQTPAAKSMDAISDLSFQVVSHVAFTGHSQELKKFLGRHANRLLFIGHPFFYASQKKSVAEFYEKGILNIELQVPRITGPEYLLYLKDFLATVYFNLRLRTKFHVFIGADPLNALVGLVLKRLGLTKITIFYVIDYVPTRFNNPILNSIYRSIDKICVCNADYTWNLTSTMTKARERNGVSKDKTNQMVVPTGTRPKQYSPQSITKNTMVFLSHLRKGQGIELVLDALQEVIRDIPFVKLMVIGTGPLEGYFKQEVKRRKLVNNVIFLGYIENHDEIEEIVSKCSVGIAPYVPDPDSFTWYADPGKPKVYLGCGIPVVITRVPEVAFEIEKAGAGIAIKYDKNELADALVRLLTDDVFYRKCRLNVLEFASKYTWENVFCQAFAQVLARHK